MSLKSTLREALLCWKSAPGADLVPMLPRQPRIRRCIHQIFFSPSGAKPPAEIERSAEQIQRANPDWEYRRYGAQDMREFIERHYGARMLECFERINPAYGAARADLFRYLLMYQSGGVYLDIKSTLTRPLSAVLRADDCYLLSRWRNRPGEEFEGWGLYPEIADARGELQQWHIVAAAGHPFLRAVIARVLRNLARYNPVLHGQGWIGVMRATGPIAYTLAIEPLLERYPHRVVDAQRELGFQYSIYPRTQSNAHHALFRSHYSELAEPLVRLNAADRLLSWALIGVKRARSPTPAAAARR